MVLYFTSASYPSAVIYMGKDKFENEDLIKFGWQNDVWFHVENLSSAHVYLRLPDASMKWDAIPQDLLTDLAQLTKSNSIEGSKKDNITVIYTPWSNLKKTAGMETGQVSFFKDKMVIQTMLMIAGQESLCKRKRSINHQSSRKNKNREISKFRGGETRQ